MARLAQINPQAAAILVIDAPGKFARHADQFIYREYRTVLDFMNRKLMIEGTKLHVFDSLDKYVRRYISDENLRKILEYTIVFLGGTPKKSPAMYALMSHVDFNLGVWYPRGGMGILSEAFHKLAMEQGVKFKFNSEVDEVVVENGSAAGVRIGKELIESDIVISNADLPHSEMKLLDRKHQTYPEKYWKRKAIAPSCLLMFIGLNKRLEGLQHHNLYLSPQWDDHFEKIFDRPEWPKNPSYYVCCPSATDKTVAPEGCENLFFLVPVAPGLRDGNEVRKEISDNILDHFEGLIGERIRDSMIVMRIFSHRDFRSQYNAYEGTALGFAHTLKQTAVFRPSHYSKKVGNLYYTGQYAHPGIGVPMVVISSQILAGEIVKEHG
ncbi:MAG: phytoene desaturase family protein, partial [Thermoplasmatota archaeon]